MDGVFNNTVHSKPLNDVTELRSRISGLLLRIGELKAENESLRAMAKLREKASACKVSLAKQKQLAMCVECGESYVETATTPDGKKLYRINCTCGTHASLWLDNIDDAIKLHNITENARRG